jgi:hypothetical protein
MTPIRILASLSLLFCASTAAFAQSSGGRKGITVIPCSATTPYQPLTFHGATIDIAQYCGALDQPTALTFSITYGNSYVYATADDANAAAPTDTTPNPAYVTHAAILKRYVDGLSAADEKFLSQMIIPALDCSDGYILKPAIHRMLMTDWNAAPETLPVADLDCHHKIEKGYFHGDPVTYDFPELFSRDGGSSTKISPDFGE